MSVAYCFFFNDTATTEIYTLSLHDALPICQVLVAQRHRGLGHLADRATAVGPVGVAVQVAPQRGAELGDVVGRSEEHTSELQSRQYLVCRLLLEKKKNAHSRSTTIRRYLIA